MRQQNETGLVFRMLRDDTSAKRIRLSATTYSMPNFSSTFETPPVMCWVVTFRSSRAVWFEYTAPFADGRSTPFGDATGASVIEPGNEMPLARNVKSREELYWTLWAMVAAFGTYFSMYGFRKPFTAASFSGATGFGLSFKTVLVTSQVAGYMISKFVGIKVISEMPAHRRAAGIVLLIGLAELALILFGIVPRPWNAACLFLNGLPLGMVFGLVLGFLEGRRMTEALTAGLCASFILADGVTKSVGAQLLTMGVPEDWMPAAAGLVFLAPLLLGVVLLAQVPPPSSLDVAARAERMPLSRAERWSLFRKYAFGLSLLVLMYLMITVVRSVRADFAPEIWAGLGSEVDPAIFSRSEILVALVVLLISGSLVYIRDSRLAFFVSLGVCGFGIALMGVAVVGLRRGWCDGFGFMVIVGTGLYLPYVATHTTLFERFLALAREKGNLGFLMYLADSIGYLGYVAVMVARQLWTTDGDLSTFFEILCWISILLCGCSIAFSWVYFAIRCPARKELPLVESPV